MTDFRIDRFVFEADHVSMWQRADPMHDNWPVVYLLSGDDQIYVGETVNAATRVLQHLSSPERKHLKRVQIILNRRFNKSACLDLESHLIRFFAADAKYKVLNGNWGVSESDYYQREEYRRDFDKLFDELFSQGFLSRPVPELINTSLFKYSPFKALNSDQSIALNGILEAFFADLEQHAESEMVVQGDPGTGKTIVAIYLVKLLRDISLKPSDEIVSRDSIFADHFTDFNKHQLIDLKIGLVIPQQSLRATIKQVFSKTPGLNPEMILSPFDVGNRDETWDLLIVDEAHRLGIRASQASGIQNKQFSEINLRLFGTDSFEKSQLDWVRKKSIHRVLLIDSEQSIKPADLPREVIDSVFEEATNRGRSFRLSSQMRIRGGRDYIEFAERLLSDAPQKSRGFGDYDLRFFSDFKLMREEILKKNDEYGLSRLLAGFAWPWKSRKDGNVYDIEIEGQQLFWNRTATNWVNSPTSPEEVGSIHTIQGYDLNYAGVIIGRDLRFDEDLGRIVFDRDNYFDAKGKENNRRLGIEYTDDDIRQYVLNIYRVLLTRGIRGTYVYVVDEKLRRHVRQLFD